MSETSAKLDAMQGAVDETCGLIDRLRAIVAKRDERIAELEDKLEDDGAMAPFTSLDWARAYIRTTPQEEVEILHDALRRRVSEAEHSRVLCENERLAGELAQARLELHNAGAAERRRAAELAQDVDDWRELAEEALDALEGKAPGVASPLRIRFEALDETRGAR